MQLIDKADQYTRKSCRARTTHLLQLSAREPAQLCASERSYKLSRRNYLNTNILSIEVIFTVPCHQGFTLYCCRCLQEWQITGVGAILSRLGGCKSNARVTYISFVCPQTNALSRGALALMGNLRLSLILIYPGLTLLFKPGIYFGNKLRKNCLRFIIMFEYYFVVKTQIIMNQDISESAQSAKFVI